jgi:hypothetical protein
MKLRTFEWTRRILGYSSLTALVFGWCAFSNFGGSGYREVSIFEVVAGWLFFPSLIIMFVTLGMLIVDWFND